MTVYPQEYTLDCTKIGFYIYVISIKFGNTALASYNCDDRHTNNCPGTVLVNSTYTKRYTVNSTWDGMNVNITWDGMNVSNGSISQSNNGDQIYQCIVKVTDQPTRIRSVIIKGNKLHLILKILQYIICTCILVPGSAPSSLTAIRKTATTITVSWTALDSSDADGYVVNVTNIVQTVQVKGSSNNTISLNGLDIETTYSITVSAYQQLLGPASSAISVQTLSTGIATAPFNVLVTLLMYF